MNPTWSFGFDNGLFAALPFLVAGTSADDEVTTTEQGEMPMESLLLWVGRLAGLAGIVLCTWAVYSRVAGSYFAGGFQVGTLMQAGMAAILIGCLCLLVVLTNRPPR